MAEDDPEDDDKPFEKKVVDDVKRHVLFSTGYKRPPKETQFKKGTTGNARGRPRGSPSDLSFSDQPMLKAALRAGQSKIKVREGEQIKEVPKFEALVEALLSQGLKGNARSAGLVLDMLRAAEQAHAREIAEEVELWSKYKEFYSHQIELARRTGQPEPAIYPHPDDIVIDKDGPRFLGPWDEAQNKQVLHTVQTCEVLLMQDELDRRSETRLDGSPVKEPGAALYMAKQLNETLPPRLKLSDSRIIRLQMRFHCIAKRTLLKQLHAEWGKIGQPKPRGFVFPDMTAILPEFAAHKEFATKVVSGTIDLSHSSLQEIVDLIQVHVAERIPYLKEKLRAVLARLQDTRPVGSSRRP